MSSGGTVQSERKYQKIIMYQYKYPIQNAKIDVPTAI